MGITELIYIIKENGISIVIIAIFIYLLIYLINIGLEYLRNYLKLSKFILKDHDLFSKLTNYIVNDIENIEASYESKKNMAKDYLKISFYLFKIMFYNLLNDLVINESKEKIYNKILDLLSNYENKLEEEAIKLGINELFISKYIYYSYERNKSLKKFIERIIFSEAYNNKTKIIIIMDNFIKEFEGTLFDIKNTIRDINGELKDIKYDQHIKNINDLNILFNKNI